MKRAAVAVGLGVLFVAMGVGGYCFFGGAEDENAVEMADASSDAGEEEASASDGSVGEAGAWSCSNTKTLEPAISSFMGTYLGSFNPSLGGVQLAQPFFASEFSVEDLCSTEEADPSFVRMTCLGKDARIVKVEMRVSPDKHRVVTIIDGVESKSDASTTDTCYELRSPYPKRDLERLRQTFLNDGPSDRCKNAPALKRKVTAIVHPVRMLPTEEGAELGVLRERLAWSPHKCRDSTHVKLAFQPAVAPVVDMGLFHSQCDLCRYTTTSRPKGIQFRCNNEIGSESLFIYQLGDDLYFTQLSKDIDSPAEERIRRVPLPCGAKVEFQADEFLLNLGLKP